MLHTLDTRRQCEVRCKGIKRAFLTSSALDPLLPDMPPEVYRRRTPPQSTPVAVASAPLAELPPRVPTLDAELLEAIDLLGALKQVGARLRQSRRERLVRLLGRMPTQQEAKHWLPALNELRAEPELSRAAG